MNKGTGAERGVGAGLGWRLKARRQVYANPWISVFEDRLEVAGRGPVTYGWYAHGGGVLIVPVLEDGRILLIRQYRYPVDAWCWEVPAGGLMGRKPLAVAREELREECGAVAARIRLVGRFQPNTALAQETLHVALATGVRLVGRPAPERSEFITRRAVARSKAIAWARDGRMQDGKSALALLMCEKELGQNQRS